MANDLEHSNRYLRVDADSTQGMRLDTRTFLLALALLVVFDAAAFIWVFMRRPPLTEDQWQFLESQRPRRAMDGQTTHLFLCSDCLNFAVFRRGIGGWETFAAIPLGDLMRRALCQQMPAREPGASAP